MIALRILVTFLLLVQSARSVGPNNGLHGLHFKISASHVRIQHKISSVLLTSWPYDSDPAVFNGHDGFER